MPLESSPSFRAFAAAVRANVPVLFWGQPGRTKTATITSAGRAWGKHVETLVGSTREATDFLGVMVEKDGVVSYSKFGWVQRLNAAAKGGSILFLDEFNTAAPSVMKGMLRLVQERVVGEEPLKPHVAIVAAANPADTAVDAYDLAPAMANRFLHLDWVFDSTFWLENIVTGFDNVTYPVLDRMLTADPASRRAVVAGQVVSFLNTARQHLAPEPPKDPAKAGRSWASPRSWSNAIEVPAQLEPEDQEAAQLVLTGLVGHGAGTEYLAWVTSNDLYDPFEVMNNPGIVDFRSRPDKLFTLAQSVTALGLVKAENWKPAAHVLTVFAENGKPDVALPGAEKLMNRVPAKQGIPPRFRAAFMELLELTEHRVVSAA